MITFPSSTLCEVNGKQRIIPKQKFYNHLDFTPALKRILKEDIDKIIWKNKLSPETMSIAKGKEVNELEIIEIQLKYQCSCVELLEKIDKEIPYHILFILSHLGLSQLWIGYKEESSNKESFKVTAYYHTDWVSSDNLSLAIDGLDMDTVYAGFIQQIAGWKQKGNTIENIRNEVQSDEIRKKILKKIETLENKARKEKQWNLQMAIDEEIRALKKEVESL